MTDNPKAEYQRTHNPIKKLKILKSKISIFKELLS